MQVVLGFYPRGCSSSALQITSVASLSPRVILYVLVGGSLPRQLLRQEQASSWLLGWPCALTLLARQPDLEKKVFPLGLLLEQDRRGQSCMHFTVPMKFLIALVNLALVAGSAWSHLHPSGLQPSWSSLLGLSPVGAWSFPATSFLGSFPPLCSCSSLPCTR